MMDEVLMFLTKIILNEEKKMMRYFALNWSEHFYSCNTNMWILDSLDVLDV